MALLRGPDHVFELANAAYVSLVGRDVLGKTVRDAVPEVEGQGFFELLDQVYTTGVAFTARRAPITLASGPNGASNQRFVDFRLSAHPQCGRCSRRHFRRGQRRHRGDAGRGCAPRERGAVPQRAAPDTDRHRHRRPGRPCYLQQPSAGAHPAPPYDAVARRAGPMGSGAPNIPMVGPTPTRSIRSPEACKAKSSKKSWPATAVVTGPMLGLG